MNAEIGMRKSEIFDFGFWISECGLKGQSADGIGPGA
jgi:hypothetical protein